jgi:hypothetical protein
MVGSTQQTTALHRRRNGRGHLDMPLTGRCQCGAARYEITGNPLAVYVCHCRECQKQSASAFGISLLVPAEDFHIKQGNLKTWSRQTDSGRILDCTFCQDCGSRLWHSTIGAGTVTVKGGSLDVPVDLSSATHIWTSRKLPGIVIPDGVVQFAEEPDQ